MWESRYIGQWWKPVQISAQARCPSTTSGVSAWEWCPNLCLGTNKRLRMFRLVPMHAQAPSTGTSLNRALVAPTITVFIWIIEHLLKDSGDELLYLVIWQISAAKTLRCSKHFASYAGYWVVYYYEVWIMSKPFLSGSSVMLFSLISLIQFVWINFIHMSVWSQC